MSVVPITELRIGARLGEPIYDPRESRSMLLAADMRIDERLIRRLHGRGVRQVVVSEADMARINAFRPQGTAIELPPCHDHSQSTLVTDTTRKLDMAIRESSAGLVTEEPPFESVDHSQKGSYDPDEVNDVCEQHERRVTFIDSLFHELVASKSASIDPLHEQCVKTLQNVTNDFDLFVCLGVNPYFSDYPARHSLHTAAVAVAVGCRMRLGQTTLNRLALGCILHDLGMLRVSRKLYMSPRVLPPRDFTHILDHPVLALEILEPYLDSIPLVSEIVVYQMHERMNGSGYPFARSGKELYQLSRIAQVADAFVAIVANRPHRPGMKPHSAMVRLVHDVKDGLFDGDAVRGLLEAVSLYPIGSYYEMNDGSVVRVIRSNRSQYDRPVVELWDSDRLVGQPIVVDLRNAPELKVVRAL